MKRAKGRIGSMEASDASAFPAQGWRPAAARKRDEVDAREEEELALRAEARRAESEAARLKARSEKLAAELERRERRVRASMEVETMGAGDSLPSVKTVMSASPAITAPRPTRGALAATGERRRAAASSGEGEGGMSSVPSLPTISTNSRKSSGGVQQQERPRRRKSPRSSKTMTRTLLAYGQADRETIKAMPQAREHSSDHTKRSVSEPWTKQLRQEREMMLLNAALAEPI